MIHNPDKPSAEQNILSDILGEPGKPKVKLTPEIEKEIREYLAEAQARAERGEPMTREMAEFMENVRLWVATPEKWRKGFKSVEKMKNSQEFHESQKRHISIQQWLDLLHVAKANEWNEDGEKWIDEKFRFPGGKKIEADELSLNDCTRLIHLPDGLTTGILDLSGCTGLTALPKSLKTDYLYLYNCKILEKNKNHFLPFLFTKVKKGEIKNLCIPDWPLKDGDLPEDLSMENLSINQCVGLTRLPKNLELSHDLFLSKNLHKQVIKDAGRLKREGKIKGKIEYI